jgi:hypothetical protein
MSKTSKIILISGSLILGVAVFAWFWFNSHTDDSHLKYVPKEAAAVFSIHNLEIASKIDASKLESLKPAQDAINDIPDFLMNIMTDPMSTGIDPVQNFYGFTEKEKGGTVAALVVSVNDEGDFTTFAQKMFPDRKVEVVGPCNYISIDDTRGIAWNGEAATYISADQVDAKLYAEELFGQSEDESIRKDTAFNSFNAKSFDAGLWTNNNRLKMLNAETSTLGMIGMSEGYSQFFLRFEQDEIVAEYVASKSTAPSIFQTAGPPATDLSCLGTKNPLIFMSMNFDVKNLLQSASGDAMMKQNSEMMLGALGISNDQMAKLFTGSVILSVSDYKNIFATDPRVQNEMSAMMGPMDGFAGELAAGLLAQFAIEVPVTTISIGITNEQEATDIMTMIGMKKMAENFWAAPGVEMVIYTAITPTQMVITNDYGTAEMISKNTPLAGKLPEAYAKQVPLQSFALYMDFEKEHLPPLLLSPENPLLDVADIAGYVALSGVLNSASFESNANGASFHFRMNEGGDNSLMQILQFLQPK